LDHEIFEEDVPFVTSLSHMLAKEYIDLIQEVEQSAIKAMSRGITCYAQQEIQLRRDGRQYFVQRFLI
jgi:hypothetical protein